MTPKKLLTLLTIVCLLCVPLMALGQTPKVKLSAIDAKDHIGQEATVCGKVASTRYATTSRGKPTSSKYAPTRTTRSTRQIGSASPGCKDFLCGVMERRCVQDSIRFRGPRTSKALLRSVS